jgi:starch synthase
MARQLSILNVSGEILPYCKWTDGADFNSGLSLSLKEKGLDSRIMIPKYGYISERKNRIHDINRLREMPVPIGEDEDFATIKSSSFQNTRSKVQSYITTNDTYFNKLKGVIQDNKTSELFNNNLERYAFFSRSVIETCNLLSWYPDIIHINDWMSALVPAMAKTLFPDEFKNTKFVFTIQDFYDQGEFDYKLGKLTNIPEEELKNFKNKNKINLIKGALHYSDAIIITNQEYYDYILKDNDGTNGLNAVLKSRKKDVTVIPANIDHWLWNPVKDEYLIHNMQDDDWENFKYDNKVELANKFGFEYHPKRALFGMVTPITKSKGFDYLMEAIEDILKHDIQLVIMGDGNKEYKDKLKELSDEYPEKIQLSVGFDEYIGHTIYAGSDFYLNLAHLDNLGIQFMHACKYASVPVAFKNCALMDIAEGFDGEDGNCVSFDKGDKKSLLDAIDRALKLYEDKDTFIQISKNGTYEEFGWDENTELYEKVYRSLVK